MKKISIASLCVATVLITGMFNANTVIAGAKPEDKIKYRQSGYTFMRWNMQKIKKQVIKNPQQYNKEEVIAAAKTISAISESGIEVLFSPDTKTGKGWKKTRVKPELFDEADNVNKAFKDFSVQANKLLETSETGNVKAIKVQFKKLVNSCQACHKEYRIK